MAENTIITPVHIPAGMNTCVKLEPKRLEGLLMGCSALFLPEEPKTTNDGQ